MMSCSWKKDDESLAEWAEKLTSFIRAQRTAKETDQARAYLFLCLSVSVNSVIIIFQCHETSSSSASDCYFFATRKLKDSTIFIFEISKATKLAQILSIIMTRCFHGSIFDNN